MEVLDTLLSIFEFFLIYSVLGWITEVIYCAVNTGKVVNRGFLIGPVCPIYGLGMLLILYFLIPVSDNIFILFIGGMILTTSIEFLGGWILETIFNMKWWDYSDKPFNFKGYICLEFSVFWGLGVVFLVRLVQPTATAINNFTMETPLKYVLILFFIVLLADITATVMTIFKMNSYLKSLENITKELKDFSDSVADFIGNKAIESDKKIDEGRLQLALGKAELRNRAEEIYKKLHKNVYGRLISAHPQAIMKRQGIKLKEFLDKHRIDN